MLKFRQFAALCLLALLALLTLPAAAERRVALVIGNGAYQHATRLNNPANDARDMADRLKRLGFDVTAEVDATVETFDAAVATFERRLAGADLALFFYAGHGLQFSGVNYLLPIDARLENDSALKRRAVTAQDVIDKMERSAKTSLVFLDACRNNTLLRDLEQALPEQSRNAASQRGLARMDPRGTNTLIAFATAPNEVAADGSGRNSPFSTALLRHIETPSISVQDMLTSVAGDVLRQTSQRQRPEVLSRLATRVVLKELPPVVVVPPSPATPPAAAPSKEREASIAWEAVKDSCDRDRLAVFQARYGDTFFGDLAKRRMEQVEAKAMCAAPAVTAPPVVEPPKPAVGALPIVPPPKDIEDEAFVRALQTELKRVGCLAGDADGKWGESSRAALREYAKRVSMTVDDKEPPRQIVANLLLVKQRVCPLVCSEGEVIRDGKCVPAPRPKAAVAQPERREEPTKRSGGAAAFDGTWTFYWNEPKCYYKPSGSWSAKVSAGVMSGPGWTATVSANGRFSMSSTNAYGQISYSGTLTGTSASGRFNNGGGCEGAFWGKKS